MKPPSEIPHADSRQRLLDAATDVFMEEGYHASVDRIAAKAGVAKQTLYNHFPSKDVLFGEVARRCTASILVPLDGDVSDVRESLLRFGALFRVKLLGDEGLAAFRALIAEVGRFPALARAFYDNGPAQTARRLAEFLERAMQKGAVRRDDPMFAAQMLLGMLGGVERTGRLCGQPGLAAEAEAQRLAHIVDCFLLAFAPERIDR
ncbi:MAG: TetR/AcrR family transcriptional regulator [Rhodocyclaceae bacterium]|nr:TetR/AcrR family transcriptional regulator [Rhodocyclaceae bacterium]